MKILMVCLGNICRSPIAEGILRSKLIGNNHYIDSAGTASYHIGAKPDYRSINISNKNGIDISNLYARKLLESDLKDFDLIFAMDRSNYNDIISSNHKCNIDGKVFELKNFLDINYNYDEIPDPYYGEIKDFELVFELINNACDNIIKKFEL